MRTLIFAAAVAAACAPMLASSPAQAQASRTWVSGVGDDANPCSRTAPCKTFAGAISKTATNGEIDCLDPGGFGAVTITKSITLDCTGTFGSILVSGTNGINVSAAGGTVTLRGIVIQGITTGLTGINFTAGAGLVVENVQVENFNSTAATGLMFAPNSANATLQIANSYFINNGISPTTGGGIVVQPAAGGSAVANIHNSYITNNSNGITANSASGTITLTVRDTTSANNRGNGFIASGANTILATLDRSTLSSNFQNGLSSAGGATVRLNNSVIAGNATGVSGTGIRSYRNNALQGNGNDNTGIITTEAFAGQN